MTPILLCAASSRYPARLRDQLPEQAPLQLWALGNQRNSMTRLLKAPSHFNRHVLVNEKSHSSRCAVCAVTSGSISF